MLFFQLVIFKFLWAERQQIYCQFNSNTVQSITSFCLNESYTSEIKKNLSLKKKKRFDNAYKLLYYTGCSILMLLSFSDAQFHPFS